MHLYIVAMRVTKGKLDRYPRGRKIENVDKKKKRKKDTIPYYYTRIVLSSILLRSVRFNLAAQKKLKNEKMKS